jgi:carbon monoxide dehydrogenase subunit G
MKISRRATLVTPALFCLVGLPLGARAAVTSGSGQAATETRSVAEFQAISLAGSIDLQVRQGAQQTLQVQADDNLIALLETLVEPTSHGPTLVVRWKPGQSLRTRAKVLVSVVLPRLTALSASGSGDMRIEPFNTPSLQVAISGSGDAQLVGLTTAELGVRIVGSGDVRGSGTAGRLKVSIAGSGDVRLADLRADDVTVSIAGSGDAAVNAQKSLDVKIAGSGDVTYTGNATLQRSVAGSGSVSKR